MYPTAQVPQVGAVGDCAVLLSHKNLLGWMGEEEGLPDLHWSVDEVRRLFKTVMVHDSILVKSIAQMISSLYPRKWAAAQL